MGLYPSLSGDFDDFTPLIGGDVRFSPIPLSIYNLCVYIKSVDKYVKYLGSYKH